MQAIKANVKLCMIWDRSKFQDPIWEARRIVAYQNDSSEVGLQKYFSKSPINANLYLFTFYGIHYLFLIFENLFISILMSEIPLKSK